MRISGLAMGLLYCGAGTATAATFHDNNAGCDCYEIDAGGEQAYFANFRFYDFSHEANSSSDFETEPPLVTVAGGKESVTSPFFNSTAFASDWGVQSWGAGPSASGLLPRWNSAQNVYFLQTNASDLSSTDSTASTFLRLRASRNPTFYSIGEIENTQDNLYYASIRFYARVTGSNGTCGGMFLFADDNDETDTEILTNNPGQIYYSNQPDLDSAGNEIPGSTYVYNGTDLDWTQWHEHRVDWTPNITYWYVDGTIVANMTYHVPHLPMGTIINMWSDGSEWTGDMPANGVSTLDVQWMQAAFNTSGPKAGRWSTKRDESGCSQVCKIDGVSKAGYPEFGSPDFPASESINGQSGSSGIISAGGSKSEGSRSNHNMWVNLRWGQYEFSYAAAIAYIICTNLWSF